MFDVPYNPDNQDETSDHYSTELDAANILHRLVVRNRDMSKKFRSQAEHGIELMYPDLSIAAKKRILTIINPDNAKREKDSE